MVVEWLDANKLIVLLTIGTLFVFGWLFALRERLHMKWYVAIPIAILHTLIGVLSVKIFAFMETGFALDSLGNMSLFGGVFFMPLVYWAGAKLTKRNLGLVCDLLTPCMIFTVMCARVNCILSGCCFGLPIPGMNGLRWPTREAELVFYLVLLVLLVRKVWRSQTHGEIYPLYMASYGAFRFVVEFFRYQEYSLGIFHLSHLWAAVSFAIGLSIYVELQAKGKKVRR